VYTTERGKERRGLEHSISGGYKRGICAKVHEDNGFEKSMT